jgi:hypothetical protein
VFGDGLLKGGEDLVDPGVVSDGEIDGFVVVGWGDGLRWSRSCGDKNGDGEEESCEVDAHGHSVSLVASRARGAKSSRLRGRR